MSSPSSIAENYFLSSFIDWYTTACMILSAITKRTAKRVTSQNDAQSTRPPPPCTSAHYNHLLSLELSHSQLTTVVQSPPYSASDLQASYITRETDDSRVNCAFISWHTKGERFAALFAQQLKSTLNSTVSSHKLSTHSKHHNGACCNYQPG